MKLWNVIIVGILLAGFVGLNVLAYNHARAMMRFTAEGIRTGKPEALGFRAKLRVLLAGVNIPRPTSKLDPSDVFPGCLALSIPGSGKVTLGAWYWDRGEGTPLVILFHGYGAEKTSLLPEAGAFLDLGASVLLVDFRGCGDSSEFYATMGVMEAEDVISSVGYAREHLPHASVVLFGQSMGAAAILRAVHQGKVSPGAVIVEAVFDTMLHTVRNRFHAMRVPSFPSAELLVFWGGAPWGFNGFAHNPVGYARSLRCRSLFMHGTADPRATIEEGRRVYEAAPDPKRLVVFAGAGHESYVAGHPEEWKAAVARILWPQRKEP